MKHRFLHFSFDNPTSMHPINKIACPVIVKSCFLIFQDLNVINSQGDVISYTIMLNSSSGQSYLFHNVSSQVQSVYLDFPVVEGSVYDVYGWTLNAQGISVSYSYMRIPTRNKGKSHENSILSPFIEISRITVG